MYILLVLKTSSISSELLLGKTIMASGMIYEVDAAFLPAPLIDKAKSLDFHHWVNKKNENSFLIFFILKT